MNKWESECTVCGEVKSHWDMTELRGMYRIFPDLVDVCNECGKKLNVHVNYYGKKKEKDKNAVRQILLNGHAVNQRFSALMSAGYK